MMYCGIDVAKLKHAVSLMDDKGQTLKAASPSAIFPLDTSTTASKAFKSMALSQQRKIFLLPSTPYIIP